VQPKAVMFPTDAKLLNRAREREGSVSALVGRQGAMKPAGSERNMAAT
jgi:hypothetical protein